MDALEEYSRKLSAMRKENRLRKTESLLLALKDDGGLDVLEYAAIQLIRDVVTRRIDEVNAGE